MRSHSSQRLGSVFSFLDVVEEVKKTLETSDSLAHCFAFALLLPRLGSDLMQTAPNSDSH